MYTSADQIQDRGHMIKRLNNFILTSVKKIRIRSVGAVLLGGFAGLSLNSTIIPTAMSTMGVTDEFSARWAVGGYAIYTVMVWAVGGWATRRIGNSIAGAITLGSVGLISGTLLTAAAIGTDITTLFIGGITGLVYGAVGGILIAKALGDIQQSPDRANLSQ